MKLGTLRDGTRDGCLLVVSRDLKRAVRATDIAPTLLNALESWEKSSRALEKLSAALNAGSAPGAFDLDVTKLAAPLPRTWQWLDGSAFHSHGELMQKVFKLAPIEGAQTRPLMYQGGSDDLLGACADMPFPSEKDGIDFEAEVTIVTDRVPLGTPADKALSHVKLVMLANDASLRVLAPVEMKTGFGWIQAKPATSFSPVAVTPDELGPAWKNGRVCLPVRVSAGACAVERRRVRASRCGRHGFRISRADCARCLLAEPQRRDHHRLRDDFERELPHGRLGLHR